MKSIISLSSATLAVMSSLSSSTAFASENAAKYEAFGMPSLYLIVVIIVIACFYRKMMESLENAKKEVSRFVMTVISIMSLFACLFLLYSSAWPYGLMGVMFYIVVLLLAGHPDSAKHANKTAVMIFIWFLLLVGIPAGPFEGVLQTISYSNCGNNFPWYKSVVCSHSYITAVLFFTVNLIGGTLLLLIMTVNIAVQEMSSDQYANYEHGERLNDQEINKVNNDNVS
eukprot:Tbor_TRINITY_DN8249_c0_g1::TRINITY_DN8249_c0_g1_i1::g.15404::m.15404